MVACNVCSGKDFASNAASGKLARREATQEQLAAAAQSGCQSCRRIYEVSMCPFGDDSKSNMVWWYDVNPSLLGGVCVNGRLMAIHRANMMTQGGLITYSPTAEDCVAAIRKLQLDCESSHVRCEALRNSDARAKKPYWPTRLLHVGGTAERSEPRVYVPLEDQDDPLAPGTPYVALSHCWGKHQLTTTTKATLEERKSGISLRRISKTFQDAIRLTRALGIDFIWIDSLCIIQDDMDDWAKEASELAKIYNNASLTIAATSASDGTQGFFPRRDATALQFVREIGDNTYTIRSRNPAAHYIGGSGSLHRWPAKNTPLLDRAWCFQEQILSPRMVHLTDNEIVWDCHEGAFCECGHLAGHFQTYKDPSRVKADFATALRDPSRMSAAWKEMLEEFSYRKITYEHDRLPAVSGVGAHFEPTLGRYYAGHWEVDLPYSLLWVSKYGPGTRAATSAHSNPPSWSWASINSSHITWQRWTKGQRSIVDITDINCQPSTTDPLGMVTGGSITMRATTFGFRLDYPQDLDEETERSRPPEYKLSQLDLKGNPRNIPDVQLKLGFQPDVPLTNATDPIPPRSTVYFVALAQDKDKLVLTLSGIYIYSVGSLKEATSNKIIGRRFAVGAIDLAVVDKDLCTTREIVVV